MLTISRTGRLLRALVRIASERPRLTVLLSLALGALGIAYTAHALTFKTSTLHLLPPDFRFLRELLTQSYSVPSPHASSATVAPSRPVAAGASVAPPMPCH